MALQPDTEYGVRHLAGAKRWPDLPVGVKSGVFGQSGTLAFVGLGSAGTALFRLDLSDPSKGWAECAGFPGPATEGAAGTVAGGRLFVFSGAAKPHPDAASAIVVGDVYAYEIAADRWEKIATETPAGLLGASAIALDSDRIAIFGGYNKEVFNAFVRDAEAIDKVCEPQRWQAFLHDFMGRDAAEFRWNTKVLVYSITSNTWSEAGENPHLPNAGAALVASAKGFTLLGGEIKPGLRTDRVQAIRFEGDTTIWTTLPPLPSHADGAPSEGPAGAFAGYIGKTLIVAGGTFFPGARANYEAGILYAHKGVNKTWRDEIFALWDGAWLSAGRLPVGLAYGASFATENGLLLVGGEDSNGNSTNGALELILD